MKNELGYGKLHVWSLALALGIMWGISMFLAGLSAFLFGLGVGFVETMRTLYLGYNATVVGSIIGGIWGFIDMFIFGVIFAAIYNFFVSRFIKSHYRTSHHKESHSKETGHHRQTK